MRNDDVILDRVRMYPIIDFSKLTFDRPIKLLLLFSFQPLELLDDIQIDLRRDPRCELQRDILVGVSAAVIFTRFGNNAYCIDSLYPFLGVMVK